jgi:methyl-accepting chemotaxis protein
MSGILSWWYQLGMQERLQVMTQFFVMIVTFAVQFWIQHAMEERTYRAAEDRGVVIAHSLLHGANMMMINGAFSDVEQRKLYTERMNGLEGVKSIALLRGESVSKQYGNGLTGEQAQDAWEKAGITQRSIQIQHSLDGEGHKLLRVMVPYAADTHEKGTPCLSCHQANKNDVLGAASLVIDMQGEVDELHSLNMMMWLGQFLIQVLLFLIIRSIAKSITHPVIELENTMLQIEQASDLTKRAKLSVHRDEIYMMAEAFNSLVCRLQSMLKMVNGGSLEVRNASSSLNKTTRHILTGIEKQRSRAEEVAQSVQSIKLTADEVNSKVEQASSMSQEAWSVADQGSNVVKMTAETSEHLAVEVSQMADAISKLGEQSERVGGIVSSIGDIAEQTNLLALNAAIEAARAGDQGRGFAVVAEEVRALSIRTSQATDEITEVIRTIQSETDLAVNRMRTTVEQVQLGVRYSHEAESALGRIRQASLKTSERIQEISDAMQMQLREADRISREMGDITNMADANVTEMSKTLSASEDMQKLALSLENQVQKFKV